VILIGSLETEGLAFRSVEVRYGVELWGKVSKGSRPQVENAC